ncbi:MAG: alkaline phosphatase family protein [Nocardioidaceae bacterium]
MPRKITAALGVLSLALLALGSAVASAPARATAGHSATIAADSPITADSPIKHVVIIYQENHSFDDVLGQLCQTRATPCNGYTGPVTFADGIAADNVVEPDVIPNIVHDPHSQALGMSDNWDGIVGCQSPPYNCITHIDPANIPNLASLTNTFTVSDATFASNPTASFGAHVTLAAGTINGFAGNNPVKSTTGVKPGPGWGCPSHRDALWGPPGSQTYVPSCIPDARGRGPYRSSPVPNAPTIMQHMENKGLSWHIYQGTSTVSPSNGTFAVCTYFAWCLRNRFNLNYDSSSNDFLTAAQGGTLPNLSMLIPAGGVSQHNGTSMVSGDNYIGQMVSAAENGPEWDSTAIFITYDDCGCFYDHVTPPSGLGMRNPMVIVSPWAKPGYTDSTVAVQPYSMLAFVQHAFGLAPLTSNVDNAYDYADAFDFTQQPVSGPAMTTTTIPRSEQRQLARLLPEVDDDPT